MLANGHFAKEYGLHGHNGLYGQRIRSKYFFEPGHIITGAKRTASLQHLPCTIQNAKSSIIDIFFNSWKFV